MPTEIFLTKKQTKKCYISHLEIQVTHNTYEIESVNLN